MLTSWKWLTILHCINFLLSVEMWRSVMTRSILTKHSNERLIRFALFQNTRSVSISFINQFTAYFKTNWSFSRYHWKLLNTIIFARLKKKIMVLNRILWHKIVYKQGRKTAQLIHVVTCVRSFCSQQIETRDRDRDPKMTEKVRLRPNDIQETERAETIRNENWREHISFIVYGSVSLCIEKL